MTIECDFQARHLNRKVRANRTYTSGLRRAAAGRAGWIAVPASQKRLGYSTKALNSTASIITVRRHHKFGADSSALAKGLNKMERETELTQAIESAFDPTAIDAFVGSLNQRNVSINSLVEVSSDLTEFLSGSAYKTGGSFRTSFLSEFQALDTAAQRRVEARYKTSIASVSRLLRRKYPKVFR